MESMPICSAVTVTLDLTSGRCVLVCEGLRTWQYDTRSTLCTYWCGSMGERCKLSATEMLIVPVVSLLTCNLVHPHAFSW